MRAGDDFSRSSVRLPHSYVGIVVGMEMDARLSAALLPFRVGHA